MIEVFRASDSLKSGYSSLKKGLVSTRGKDSETCVTASLTRSIGTHNPQHHASQSLLMLLISSTTYTRTSAKLRIQNIKMLIVLLHQIHGRDEESAAHPRGRSEKAAQFLLVHVIRKSRSTDYTSITQSSAHNRICGDPESTTDCSRTLTTTYALHRIILLPAAVFAFPVLDYAMIPMHEHPQASVTQSTKRGRHGQHQPPNPLFHNVQQHADI
jgi:hypothetical protein